MIDATLHAFMWEMAKQAKAPEGFRPFGGVYVDARIPTLKSLPSGAAGRKLLSDVIERSEYKEHSHPPVAVKDLDLKGLRFKPTRLALPMPWERPGEVSWRSGKLHAHRAGPIYLVHKDSKAPGAGVAALLDVVHGVKDVVPAVAKRLIHPFARPQFLEKKAEEESSAFRRYAPVAAGVGGAALAAGGLIAARPGLRAEFLERTRALVRGRKDRTVPDDVRQQARAIVEHLRARGVDPSKARIGMSGVGGVGKSTLARELAEQMGGRHVSGDQQFLHGGFGLHGAQMGEAVARNPIAPGTVSEQVHLLNQVDPDQFDVLLHLDKPPQTVRDQLFARGRRAFQSDYIDNDKLRRATQHGFDATEGAAAELAPGMRVKLRGPEGFKSQQLLERRARDAAIDPSGLSREQLLHSLASGGRSRQRGSLAYLRKGRVAGDVGLVGAGGVAGTVAGRQLAGGDSTE